MRDATAIYNTIRTPPIGGQPVMSTATWLASRLTKPIYSEQPIRPARDDMSHTGPVIQP